MQVMSELFTVNKHATEFIVKYLRLFFLLLNIYLLQMLIGEICSTRPDFQWHPPILLHSISNSEKNVHHQVRG